MTDSESRSTPGSRELEGRRALVTGGASGIGAATARRLGEMGCRMVIADADEAAGERTAEELRKEGMRAAFIGVELGNSAAAEKVVNASVSQLGGLDILVSNAGINPRGTVLTTDDELLDRIIDVNLKALFHLCRYAIPELEKSPHPAIATVSSINGLVAWDNEAAYDASKGGVVMLTRALAVDHAKHGIRVNCVCPGITDTPMLQRTASSKPDPAAFLKEASRMQPLPRLGRPEDVANAIAFLVSDRAAYITGVVLPVDGGYTAV